jgi:hypothetical protein
MGLLFRPRSPVTRLAAVAASAARDAGADPGNAVRNHGDGRAALLMRALAGPIEMLAARAGAFSEVELAADAAVVEDRGYAEWIVTARHTGSLPVDEEIVIAPTGRRVTIRGVTVAEFSGDRICSFRQYWDELALLEGLRVLPRD